MQFLCSHMRMNSYGASYYIDFKNEDFQTQRASYEENTRVVPQLTKALARAQE